LKNLNEDILDLLLKPEKLFFNCASSEPYLLIDRLNRKLARKYLSTLIAIEYNVLSNQLILTVYSSPDLLEEIQSFMT